MQSPLYIVFFFARLSTFIAAMRRLKTQTVFIVTTLCSAGNRYAINVTFYCCYIYMFWFILITHTCAHTHRDKEKKRRVAAVDFHNLNWKILVIFGQLALSAALALNLRLEGNEEVLERSCCLTFASISVICAGLICCCSALISCLLMLLAWLMHFIPQRKKKQKQHSW